MDSCLILKLEDIGDNANEDTVQNQENDELVDIDTDTHETSHAQVKTQCIHIYIVLTKMRPLP